MESLYQRHKEAIEKIKQQLKDIGISYTYRTYQKSSVTFWRCETTADVLLLVAHGLLRIDGVHEANVLVRNRNCITNKELWWGPYILRLTVHFYDF